MDIGERIGCDPWWATCFVLALSQDLERENEEERTRNRIEERSIRLCRDLVVQKADRRRSLVSVSCRNEQSERFWVLVCFAFDSLKRSVPTFGCFRIESVMARLADRNQRRGLGLGLVDLRRRRPTNRSQEKQRFSAWFVAKEEIDRHRRRRMESLAAAVSVSDRPSSQKSWLQNLSLVIEDE